MNIYLVASYDNQYSDYKSNYDLTILKVFDSREKAIMYINEEFGNKDSFHYDELCDCWRFESTYYEYDQYIEIWEMGVE